MNALAHMPIIKHRPSGAKIIGVFMPITRIDKSDVVSLQLPNNTTPLQGKLRSSCSISIARIFR
jgi:hypothetical protein